MSRLNAKGSPVDLNEQEATPLSLSQYLRILGALAVVGSGVVYLLQGLHNIDSQLRYGTYLLLMLALGCGGIFSYRVMHDMKGARLFFALAALLVPVQFAQLGGMIYSFLSIAEPDPHAITTTGIGLVAGATLILGAMVSRFGFATLVRPFAAPLTVYYLLACLCLLIPLRILPLGFIPIVAVCAATWLAHRSVFRSSPRFTTPEGFAVRAMFTLPLAIVLVRAGFYHHTDLAYGLTLAAMAVALLSFIDGCCKQGWLRESLLGLAFTAGVLASVIISGTVLSLATPLAAAYEALIYALPLLVCTLACGRQAIASRTFYHLCAAAICLPVTLVVCEDAPALAQLLYLALSAALLAWGICIRAKSLLASGTAMSALALALLSYTSLWSIGDNIWIYLALAGVVLVGLSSVLERHGRRWYSEGRDKMAVLAQWQY